MPTYEYECDACHRVFEVRQRITAAALTTCDACGGTVRRLLSAAPFILKGEGWYVTDYPSESRKKAKESESKPDKPADKPAEKPAATSAGDGAGSSSSSSSATGAASPSAPPKSD